MQERIADTDAKGRLAIPTVQQAYEFFREHVKKGRGHLHTTHPVIVEDEQAKRERGGTPDESGRLPTRIAWDAADNSVYRRWHVMRKRWMDICQHDPTLCTEAQLVLLEKVSDDMIHSILDNLGEAQVRGPAPGPPRAEIPDWKHE